MSSMNKILTQCSVVMLVCLVRGALSVPAALPDHLLQEVATMRALVASVSGQLDKFNSLYLGSLEHKMTATATSLANIDSNVKNLQERAHVWDTFQLHVSAWNEQIKTVDKKMDLLSREQEKFIDIDNKLTALLGLEYKMERVMEKMEAFDSKLLEFGEKLENCRDSTSQSQGAQKESIWSEFAGIGVLSTLKNIENKVDRLQLPPKASYKRNAGRRVSADSDEPTDPRGKFVIRCSTPPQIEEAIYDIAAKVNAIHDRMDNRPSKRKVDSMEVDSQEETSDIEGVSNRSHGIWRRLVQPANSQSESCLSEDHVELLRRVADTSQELLGHGVGVQREILASCRRTEQEMLTFTGSADILLKRVERVAVGLEGRETRRDEAAEERSREQRDHFERLLRHYSNRMAGTCSVSPADDEHNKAGSGHSGFGIRDDTEEGDAEDDDDIRIVEVDSTTSRSTTPFIDITPATTPRAETTTWKIETTTFPASTTEKIISTTKAATTTTEAVTYTTEEVTSTTKKDEDLVFISTDMATEVSKLNESESTSTTADATGVIQVAHRRCEEITDRAGVYRLGEVRDYNVAGRDFYTRYCRPGPGQGGAWTVIQSRGHGSGVRLDFSRDWQEYRDGFGDLNGDFWLGNEYIHRLTNEQEVTLRVELDDFEGNSAWAEYARFRVAGERDQYALQIGGYRGNASDSFGSHHGSLFSTRDRDNDEAPPCCPCAESYGGGWWFNSCFEANLNAPYYSAPHENEYFRGIIWEHWLGDYSLRGTRMLVRGRGSPGATATPASVPDEATPPEDP